MVLSEKKRNTWSPNEQEWFLNLPIEIRVSVVDAERKNIDRD